MIDKSKAAEAIKTVMQFWAYSSSRAKTREFILEKVNAHPDMDDVLDDRFFRRIYADICVENLFGSHPEIGYFVITSEKDLNLAIDALEKKIEALCVRKHRIIGYFEAKYGKRSRQIELAF